MNNFTFTVEHSLTEADVLDILTTAIEGGIGYWACLDNTDPNWIEARKQWKQEHNGDIPCYCDVAYRVMKNGNAIKFEDEEDGEVLELTMEKFLNGCKLFNEQTGTDIHRRIDDSEFDANDADAIIQFAVFGEIIYG